MEILSQNRASLQEAAEKVEQSSSWQFLAGTLSKTEDDFSLSVASRGPIPIIDTSHFEDINDHVEIEIDPEDSFRRIHIITYTGDHFGLEMFVNYLTGSLDGITEGEVDVIRDFVGSNPLWALHTFGNVVSE